MAQPGIIAESWRTTGGSLARAPSAG
jgi:hypothetical protein